MVSPSCCFLFLFYCSNCDLIIDIIIYILYYYIIFIVIYIHSKHCLHRARVQLNLVFKKHVNEAALVAHLGSDALTEFVAHDDTLHFEFERGTTDE